MRNRKPHKSSNTAAIIPITQQHRQPTNTNTMLSRIRCERIMWLSAIVFFLTVQFLLLNRTERGLIIMDDLDGQFLDNPKRDRDSGAVETTTAKTPPPNKMKQAKLLFHQQKKPFVSNMNFHGTNKILHVFQYGKAPPAATNIICISLFLHIKRHYPELLKNTLCNNADKVEDTVRRPLYFLQRDDMPQAVRSQVTEENLPSFKNSTVIYTTAPNEEAASKKRIELQSKGYTTALVQAEDDLQSLTIEDIVAQFAHFFQLPISQANMMIEYFEYWSELNECCGMQMSKFYRNELVPESDKKADLKEHEYCSSLDIDSVEANFMYTDLYKLLQKYELMHKMNRPSVVDGDLDGTYCSRYRKLVSEQGITVNKNLFGMNNWYVGLEHHLVEEQYHPLQAVEGILHLEGVNDKKEDSKKQGVQKQLKGSTSNQTPSKETPEKQNQPKQTPKQQHQKQNEPKQKQPENKEQKPQQNQQNEQKQNLPEQSKSPNELTFSPWITDYITFHKSSIIDGKLKDNARYIIYECIDGPVRCGGAGDRLIGMIKVFYLAICTRRVFLIDAPFPVPLEKVLNPRLIEWNATFPKTTIYRPDMFYNKSQPLELREDTPGYRIRQTNAVPRKKSLDEIWESNLMIKHLQNHKWGPLKKSTTVASLASEAFRALFQFDPAVIARAEEFKTSAGITGPYFGIHMRKGDANMGVTGQGEKEVKGLQGRAVNNGQMLTCYQQVKSLHPEAEIAYLASDDVNTKQAMSKSDSSIHYAHDMKPFHIDLLARAGGNKHFDKVDPAVLAGTIDTWAEMLVLSQSTCLILSMSMFSFGSLYMRQQGECVVHYSRCQNAAHRQGQFTYFGEQIFERGWVVMDIPLNSTN